MKRIECVCEELKNRPPPAGAWNNEISVPRVITSHVTSHEENKHRGSKTQHGHDYESHESHESSVFLILRMLFYFFIIFYFLYKQLKILVTRVTRNLYKCILSTKCIFCRDSCRDSWWLVVTRHISTAFFRIICILIYFLVTMKIIVDNTHY